MCTTFKLQNSEKITLAQGYDFYYGHGLVIVNKRGIKKVALCDSLTKQNVYDDSLKTPRWISKYGSITFNQFAREIPTCGMNEAGLAIASMWHDTEDFNKRKADDSITELQWIQYQLDCYATVSEVIDNLSEVSVKVEMYPMHYNICDRKGNNAIVEFKKGKLHVYHSFENYACSNAGIEDSIKYAQKHQGIDPNNIPIDEPILDRASKALHMTKEFNDSTDSRDAISNSFNILDAVSLQVGFKALFKWIGKRIPPSQTFWQIVFDLSESKIHFKTKGNRRIRSITISEFDYSNKSDVKVLDIEGDFESDVTKMFHSYKRSDNDRIIKKSFKPMKDEVLESEQKELIEFPEFLKPVNI